ncbi:UNKNOWN [Stylonychia lemnae]|uniref:Uncharacterized protein n=1 Tax=Stylonychia lemnae TaxID=5949 RepID=A0A078BAM6_STYLE|nr:UNKNOWN [Stylonychia lemnae]|eukprot:CDW91404.1 UNKNOWN [Stylonychia lemnae]
MSFSQNNSPSIKLPLRQSLKLQEALRPSKYLRFAMHNSLLSHNDTEENLQLSKKFDELNLNKYGSKLFKDKNVKLLGGSSKLVQTILGNLRESQKLRENKTPKNLLKSKSKKFNNQNQDTSLEHILEFRLEGSGMVTRQPKESLYDFDRGSSIFTTKYNNLRESMRTGQTHYNNLNSRFINDFIPHKNVKCGGTPSSNSRSGKQLTKSGKQLYDKNNYDFGQICGFEEIKDRSDPFAPWYELEHKLQEQFNMQEYPNNQLYSPSPQLLNQYNRSQLLNSRQQIHQANKDNTD